MGLDTTHGAWHGAYSAFNTWRTEVAKTIGITLKDMKGFGGITEWDNTHPLTPLLSHSDCDGELSAEDCLITANALEHILKLYVDKDFSGHIGSFREKTEQFINGCMLAHEANEPLEFH